MKKRTINLDLSNVIIEKNKLWKGLGMVSANNSSRLLIDYKSQCPESYEKILKLMFGKEGMNMSHLKIEMGADINSTSGTEPCTMRSPDEKCDVTRGAGFILACDVKKINPDVTLDMLWWSEPWWITKAGETGFNDYDKKQNLYKARYNWYKENLISAYETYGLKFDYVSATQNERGMDCDWIKFLSKELKSEKNCPYDFSRIKVVAGEEVCTWIASDVMIDDEEYRNAVDVVGSHYTSWCNENTRILQNKFNKEIWFSEGSSSMGFSKGITKYDGNGSGLSGLNGVLDVANRIITMFPCGAMTLYEIQPVVAAYYDGVTFCHKQFITANTPWNGYYELDPGFYMTLNFSQFIQKDWCFVDNCCFADGKPAGDGHAVGDAVYSYMTVCNPSTKDWTTIITNTTSEEIEYEFELNESILPLYSYTTTSWNIKDTLVKNKIEVFDNKAIIKIKPNSIITITTLDKEPLKEIKKLECNCENKVLALPYTDNFSYANKEAGFISSRGNAPLYTCDIGGAFEIVQKDGKNCIKQKITLDTKAKEWGGTPEPVTNFGDDRWYNYSASIDVQFCEQFDSCSYCGIGIRYNLPDAGKNGLWLQFFIDGKWKLNKGKNTISEGNIQKPENGTWTNLKIKAVNNTVEAFINQKCVACVTEETFLHNLCAAGRCAIFSSYNENLFANLAIEPFEKAYIKRFDNLDDCFTYDSNWEHGIMESFKCYKRTVSHGKSGSVCNVVLKGTGFSITGYCNEETEISVKIDDYYENKTINPTDFREVLYSFRKMVKGIHKVSISVLKGQLNIDSLEVTE